MSDTVSIRCPERKFPGFMGSNPKVITSGTVSVRCPGSYQISINRGSGGMCVGNDLSERERESSVTM